jgi:phospholipase C
MEGSIPGRRDQAFRGHDMTRMSRSVQHHVGDVLDPAHAERLDSVAPDEGLRRREFFERTAKTLGIGIGLAATMRPEALLAEVARRQRQSLPSPRNMPIDTFVVVMMENRSFDHFLGWMPKADGRQAGLTYKDSTGKSFSTHPLVGTKAGYQGCGFNQPGHTWKQGRVQFDNGRCDGFVFDRSGNDTFALGYYRKQDLPYLPHLALKFTTYDRYFPSLLSSTNPNRAYMHAAQSYGDKNVFRIPGDGAPQYPPDVPGFPYGTTIESHLARRGHEATTFYSDINYAAMWGREGMQRGRPISRYFARAAKGHLPALSFVDPQLQSIKEGKGVSNDDHPWSDVRTGENFIAEVVTAFMNSPQWKRGALFLVFDEWGGFFDHVRPPSVPDDRQSSNVDEDFGQTGFRVPAIAVSPYVRRDAVSHTTFSHESILALVCHRFGITPFTKRLARTNNIGTSFRFRDRPHLKVPDLPTPRHVISQPCPS